MEHILSLSAIREQKAALNRIILDSQSQLADLEVAERIVRRFGQSTEDARPTDQDIEDLLGNVHTPQKKIVRRLKFRRNPLTTRSLLTSVLRESGSVWMTANEIQERASAIKGENVSMPTISPTLTYMKNDGVIVRDGFKIALAERLNESGELAASPLAPR